MFLIYYHYSLNLFLNYKEKTQTIYNYARVVSVRLFYLNPNRSQGACAKLKQGSKDLLLEYNSRAAQGLHMLYVICYNKN